MKSGSVPNPATMLAMRLHSPGTPLRAERVPVPEPGPGQVLIKVAACGVCRTDLHVVDGDLREGKYPLAPGHEIVGRVVKGGARFAAGERDDYPPFVENYFTRQGEAILDEYREQVMRARSRNEPMPEMPESLVATQLDNTWHDSAEAVINNWIGMVYQLTHHDRRTPFKAGIDPEDPLGLLLDRR